MEECLCEVIFRLVNLQLLGQAAGAGEMDAADIALLKGFGK